MTRRVTNFIPGCLIDCTVMAMRPLFRLRNLRLVVGLAGLLAGCGTREPTYGGKSLSQWFAEAQNYGPLDREVWGAFVAIEGEAVPYLIREIQTVQRLRAKRGINTPNPWLRSPVNQAIRRLGFRTDIPDFPDTLGTRLDRAYELLAVIATRQRLLAERGTPSTKPSVTNAFPILYAALTNAAILTNPATWDPAIQGPLRVISSVGPGAAEFVPVLISLLTNSAASEFVGNCVFALGEIGKAALPAAPLIEQVAADTTRPIYVRYIAARVLGEWVPGNSTAVDTMTDLLIEVAKRPDLKQNRAQLITPALASLGRTPERAVPVLEQLTHDTNQTTRVAALIALWNHRPEDEKLRAEIATNLTADPLPALIILTRLGPQAAVFAPQVQGLTNHPQAHTRDAALKCLRSLVETGP